MCIRDRYQRGAGDTEAEADARPTAAPRWYCSTLFCYQYQSVLFDPALLPLLLLTARMVLPGEWAGMGSQGTKEVSRGSMLDRGGRREG
eukprot:76435-Rhodomonas_salina.1